MGLTKQYLAFKPVANFNIIASGRANVAFVSVGGVDGRFVAVAGAEQVLVWNTRLVCDRMAKNVQLYLKNLFNCALRSHCEILSVIQNFIIKSR